jgi:hypothetical protein
MRGVADQNRPVIMLPRDGGQHVVGSGRQRVPAGANDRRRTRLGTELILASVLAEPYRTDALRRADVIR